MPGGILDIILIRGCRRRVYLWRIRTFVGRPVTFQRTFPRPTICFCCFRPAFGWLLILALLLYSMVVRWEEGDFCCLLPIHHFLQWMNVVIRAIVHTAVVIFHQLLLLLILPVILFLRSLFCDELMLSCGGLGSVDVRREWWKASEGSSAMG